VSFLLALVPVVEFEVLELKSLVGDDLEVEVDIVE